MYAKMKYKFITTMSKEYYDNFGTHMIDSFLKFGPESLTVYTEDFTPTQAVDYLDINQTSPDLKNYLDDLGSSRARGFGYKAYSIIHALEQRDFDRLIFLDADLIFFRKFNIENVEEWAPKEYGFAYLGVTNPKYGGHADTCLFVVDKTDPNFELFLDTYKTIYTSRLILDKNYFVKPNDSYAFAYALGKCQGSKILDWHEERTSLSPMNESVLGKYMRHLKASRKDNTKVIGAANKLSIAIEKGKNIDKVIERFDRQVRKKNDLDVLK